MSKEFGGLSKEATSQQAALYGTHQATIDKLLKERSELLKRTTRIERKVDKLIRWVEVARKARGEA
jgi:hypothetical protein